MSEFECINGHLVVPSEGYCLICGGRAVRMDGLSAGELDLQEHTEPDTEQLEAEQNDEI